MNLIVGIHLYCYNFKHVSLSLQLANAYVENNGWTEQ